MKLGPPTQSVNPTQQYNTHIMSVNSHNDEVKKKKQINQKIKITNLKKNKEIIDVIKKNNQYFMKKNYKIIK